MDNNLEENEIIVLMNIISEKNNNSNTKQKQWKGVLYIAEELKIVKDI